MRFLARLSSLVLLATLVALVAPRAARADTVVLKNGRILYGKVVAAGPEAVILEVQCGSGHGKIKIPRAEVADVHEDTELVGPEGPTGIAPPEPANASRTLESTATPDLEERLRGLGPSREELLAELEPTPEELDALVKLERGLDAGTPEAAKALAGRGRPALLVAARALTSPSRTRRAAAAQTVALVAKDERSLPYVLALDLPSLLLQAASDEAEQGSPRARYEARRALEAIAKRDPAPDQAAGTVRLADEERVSLGLWKDWWESEKKDVAGWEEPRARERAAIRDELWRRGVNVPGMKKGRIEVKPVADEEPGIPEATILQPRLVLHPPTDLAIEGTGDARALRFGVAIENQGVGPLELRVSSTGRLDDRAVQKVLARYPGSDRLVTERERTIGALVPDVPHRHRHLDRVLRFELLDETFAAALGSKGGESPACLRDAKRVGAGGPLEPRYGARGGELQGISVGWETVSDRSQAGQGVALGATPDGVYYLVVALPLGFEGASTADDLLAAAKVRIAGGKVTLLESLDGRTLRERRAAREQAAR